jgi:predicted restriction endonuclease
VKKAIVLDGKRVKWSFLFAAVSRDMGFQPGKKKATDLARMVCEKYGWEYTGRRQVLLRRFQDLMSDLGKNVLLAKVKKSRGYESSKEQTFIKVSEPKDPNFYDSRQWKELRYRAFAAYGQRCQCCGASRDDGVVLHVDHIRPRSKYPELELNLDNLQILCAACNIGKGAWDQTDWRFQDQPIKG